MSGIDDIVESLEISQPAFFRYFPSKDAVLGEVGIRGFACITEHLRNELSSEAMTAEHLRRLYQELARHAEADRPLWRAAVCFVGEGPVRVPRRRGRSRGGAALCHEVADHGPEQ